MGNGLFSRPRRPRINRQLQEAHRKNLHPIQVRWLTPAAAAIGLLAGLSLSVADIYQRRGVHTAEAGKVLSSAGALAGDPSEIPAKGWKEIAIRTYKAFNADQVPAWAAGVTFFALLGLFPALSAFVSLYGIFADANEARHQIESLAGLLPGGAVSVLTDQIQRLAAAKHSSLGLAFAVSLLFSIWSANAGVKALFGALNAAYEVKEARNFIRINLVSLAFTAGLVAFAIIGVLVIVAAPATLKAIGLGAVASFATLRWPAILLVVGLVLSLVYQFGPSRPMAKWRWISPGSIFAAIGWLIMSLGFSWYVANFGHYNATYGALGGVVGFMTWIWLSLIVVLFGAELNAEIERQTGIVEHLAPSIALDENDTYMSRQVR